MFEFKASDIKVGDVFTVDQGMSWWRAVRVEVRDCGDKVWIEATGVYNGAISSEVYDADDKFTVK